MVHENVILFLRIDIRFRRIPTKLDNLGMFVTKLCHFFNLESIDQGF